MINSLRLICSSFCSNEIIFKVRKRSFTDFTTADDWLLHWIGGLKSMPSSGTFTSPSNFTSLAPSRMLRGPSTFWKLCPSIAGASRLRRLSHPKLCRPHLEPLSGILPPGQTRGGPKQGTENCNRMLPLPPEVTPQRPDWDALPEPALRTVLLSQFFASSFQPFHPNYHHLRSSTT